MSILADKDTYVVIQGGVAGVNAARRMAANMNEDGDRAIANLVLVN